MKPGFVCIQTYVAKEPGALDHWRNGACVGPGIVQLKRGDIIQVYREDGNDGEGGTGKTHGPMIITSCIGCGQENVPGYKTEPNGNGGAPGSVASHQYCEVCHGTSYAYQVAVERDRRDHHKKRQEQDGPGYIGGMYVSIPPSPSKWDLFQIVARVGLLILMELRALRKAWGKAE